VKIYYIYHYDFVGGIYYHQSQHSTLLIAEGPINKDDMIQSSSSSSSSSSYETAPLGWHSVTNYHQIDSVGNYDGNNDDGDDDDDDDDDNSKMNVKNNNNNTIYNHNKRIFNEKDLHLKFISREEFSGFKLGFVFRLGAQGLGYYEDILGFEDINNSTNSSTLN